MSKASSLKDILDIEQWELLQDSFASTVGMAIITIDYKGMPLTHHSNCSSFCSIVRNDPSLNNLCHKCDARGGLEAVYSNSPYTYYCHFGIIDIAIPIVINETYHGAIMAGQIKLDQETSTADYDYVYKPKNQELIKNTLLSYQEQFNEIPILSTDKIISITETLNQLAHYIVGEAIDKQKQLDVYSTFVHKSYGSKTHAHKEVQEELSSTALDSIITDSNIQNYLSVNTSLNKAIDYIHQNKGKLVSLEEVSRICYLSPSYFSRLFKQEIGMNYNAYITKVKMLWAKELFYESDMSVNQISDALGYKDTGYFIKKFKATYGLTPGKYKNNFT